MNLKTLQKQGFKYVCGVDEAGRGPLAGPLSLSFFVVSIKDYKKVLNPLLKLGLNDSKKLKEEKREELLNILQRSDLCKPKNKAENNKKTKTKVGPLFFNAMVSAEQIDKNGIAKCYQILIKRLLARSEKREARRNEKTYFFLDGAIKFPEEFSHKVIIHGDSIEPVIMVASVVSKVKRDRYMKRISKKYPNYNFEIHKGYGTKKHRELIKKFGLSKEHRKSFCNNLIK